MADPRGIEAGSKPPADAAPRRKAFEHPGRFAIVAIGLMAVVSLLVFAGMGADTSQQSERNELPSEIVSVDPAPGTLAKPQQAVTVILRSDLTGVLVINGNEIPEDQLDRPTQSTMTFQPGPDKDITRFPPGENRVDIVYWPAIRTRDDAKTFTVAFRSTA